MASLASKPEAHLKVALDELRMQMLGAQVLFGFQFNSGFQTRTEALSWTSRLVDVGALMLIVMAIGVVIAVPCQHRLIEKGEITGRIYQTATRYAGAALLPIALALAGDFYIVGEVVFGTWAGALGAAIAGTGSLTLLYVLPALLRPSFSKGTPMSDAHATSLHTKIDQMLTEARVILPGAQALLGFQFVVVLTQPFATMPLSAQIVHFIALCATAIAIVLLIAPAAVHRLSFAGADTARMLHIGSTLVTVALLPMAIGIALDLYVATLKILGEPMLAIALGSAALLVLLGFWYVFPLAVANAELVPTAAPVVATAAEQDNEKHYD